MIRTREYLTFRIPLELDPPTCLWMAEVEQRVKAHRAKKARRRRIVHAVIFVGLYLAGGAAVMWACLAVSDWLLVIQ